MTPSPRPKKLFRIRKLEQRIAPAHVHLPGSPAHLDGPSAAAEQNPHFSGKFRTLLRGVTDTQTGQ